MHTTLKEVIILYHGDCPDGFGGAWAAWKKFGNRADYIGVHHNTPPPDGLKNKEIYIVDFGYKEEVVQELIDNNIRVTSIDHHLSAQKSTEMTKDFLFDSSHSGAVLAWNYFHPDTKVPKLLRYIEDRDLYRFQLPHSRAICVYIDSFSHEFKTWNKLAESFESSSKIKEAIKKGDIIVKYEKKLVENLIKENARLVDFEGYETYAINAPQEFASDIGAELYKKHPPISIIWREDKEQLTVSLRSDGSVDVSKIAGKFGGGGHKSSAGFRLPDIDSFPWKIKNKKI